MGQQMLTVQIDVQLQEGSNWEAIHFYLTRDVVKDWCLLLVLVGEGLIPSFVVTNPDRSLEVEVSLDESLPYRFEVQREGNRIQLRPSVVSLRYWLFFALKYYRDGQGEVDVIDDQLFEHEFKPIHCNVYFHVPEYSHDELSFEELERWYDEGRD